jgi:N4-gp56 family major capsid protein
MANNLAAFNPVIFSKRVIENLDRVNVARQLVSTDYIGDLTENSTVKIRTMGNITVAPYTGSISYQDLVPGLIDFTVDDAQYWAIRVSDIEERQTDMDALELYAKRAAVAISDTIENKIFATYTQVATANKITGASSAAITLDASNIYDTVLKARTALSKANVPTSERFLAVDPDTYSVLLKCPEFIRATASGDRVIATGEVGDFVGFRVFESNAVPVASGAKYLMYGQMGAIQYAGQLDKVEKLRLESSFDSAVRGLLLHGAIIPGEDAKRVGTIKATA